MKDNDEYFDGEVPTKHGLTIAIHIGNDFKPVGWECIGAASGGSGNARGGKDGRKKGACRQAGS
jgi:hypothetical protein